MKKLKLFVVVAGLLVAGSTSAQTAIKIGYINLDNVVALMPETKKIIDTLMPKFQADSLNPQLTYYVSEYQRKDSLLRDSVKTKLPEQVKNQMRQEMEEYANIVQNWQSYAQQVLEGKRDQMLGPVYQKVYDAVKTVAKEKGYTHVLTKDAFLVAPDADDMLLVVAQKLKLKLPPQAQPGASNPPAGAKPGGN